MIKYDKTCALNYSQNMCRHTDARAHMGADINFFTKTSARAMENIQNYTKKKKKGKYDCCLWKKNAQ